MTVLEAIALASQWVQETLCETPGFLGVYVGGSVSFMDHSMEFTEGSDIDLRVVMATGSPEPVHPRQHVFYNGIILEPSFRPEEDLLDSDQIAKDPYMGSDLWLGKIVDDPTGILSAVHRDVKEKFSRREYVLARCDTHETLNNLTSPVQNRH